MLPAIVGAWGSEPFASRELATDAGVRVVLRGLSINKSASSSPAAPAFRSMG